MKRYVVSCLRMNETSYNRILTKIPHQRYQGTTTMTSRPLAKKVIWNKAGGNGILKREIHFLPFLGMWGAKHLSTWTIYNACKAYGWPNVYRRLLEQNRMINHNNPAVQKTTKDAIRMAIEAPPKFVGQLSTEYSKVVQPFLQQIINISETNTMMPRFMVAMIKYVLNSQKPVKLVQDLAEAGAKRA